MADLEIRVDRATDAERYLASDLLVWFGEPSADPLEIQLLGVPEDQRFAAEVVGADADPATYPGVYGVRPMQLTVPDGDRGGRLLPMAGLTWVGVHPDHRRRGLLTAMMRHHMEQTRREGLAVSGLHASEQGIYGRHGYGLASLEHTAELGRGTTFTAPGLEDEVARITTRMWTVTSEEMPERRRTCDLAVLSSVVGSVIGDEGFYRVMCHESPEEKRGNEPGRILFASRDGEDLGYAVFRRTHKWDNGRPGAKVEVSPITGEPAALLALLRRLVDLDLAGTITVHGVSGDSPILWWVDGPRGTGDLHVYDSLWVRLVDLPAALAARGYEADCDVVAEVTDVAAPWNAGRWRIRISGGEAHVSPSDDDAEVALDVSALGAAYLGGANLTTMSRAGRVTEHRAGAVGELWRAFRTDVPPAAARGF